MTKKQDPEKYLEEKKQDPVKKKYLEENENLLR